MEIKLIGALEEKKIEDLLTEKIKDHKERQEIIQKLKEAEIENRSKIVSSAGRLSRFAGDVFEIIGISEEKTLEQNTKYAQRVISMGHESISDHDYLVFALKDVSFLAEQTLIAERFASFTIKSRREVDFSKAGYYIPDFHDEKGNILPNNEQIKKEFSKYIENLFKKYEEFLSEGIKKEDARFILPYNLNSNMIMGMDAHAIKNLIVKLTKQKEGNIQELKELGEQLKEIISINCPYLIKAIDQEKDQKIDKVDAYLNEKIKPTSYQIIDDVQMINTTPNIDDTILITAIMRRYQYDYPYAKKVYELACKEQENIKEELMKKIVLEGDQEELAHVNFELQIPISCSILSHLTRHRTHNLLIPSFVQNFDRKQKKIPPKIEQRKDLKKKYEDIFLENEMMYQHFKEDYHIREEDLVYFILGGNMVNGLTNMDGKTLHHILELRECNKAQWEIRKIANSIHHQIEKIQGAQNFAHILGPTCETKGICNEGKESCGKIYTLKQTNA